MYESSKDTDQGITCFGFPFWPPIVVTMIWPASVPFPSTVTPSASYSQKSHHINSKRRNGIRSTIHGRRIKITLSLLRPSTLSSLIVISFIPFGRSAPVSSALAGFILVDVLASASLWDDDDSWSRCIGLSSDRCGWMTISPNPSWSNFGLFEPESPP